MCFVDNSPYSHKMFYEHFGLKSVRVDYWIQEKIDNRRKLSFIIPESNPNFRSEIRVTAVQKYSYSKWGFSLITKFTFKHEKYSDLDIETNLEARPITSGSYKSMVTYKLFVYRGDQKKVAKKALEPISDYFKAEALYWAKEIIDCRLIGDRKARRKHLNSGSDLNKELESLDHAGAQGGSHKNEHIEHGHSVKTFNASNSPTLKIHLKRIFKASTAKMSHSFGFILHPHSKHDYLDRILLMQFIMLIAVVFILFKLAMAN